MTAMDNRMKYRFILFIGLCTFIGVNPTFSQRVVLPTDVYFHRITPAEYLHDVGVDTTSVDSVKHALEFEDASVSGQAALLLAQWNRTEVIPLIRSRIVQGCATEDISYYAYHIEALRTLNDLEILSVLYLFVDSLHVKLLRGEEIYLARALSAVELFLDRGDYSHSQFIADVLQTEWGPEIFDVITSRLLKEAPSDIREQTYSIVVNSVLRYPSFTFPSTTLGSLQHFLDRPQTISTLMTILESDSSFSARASAGGIVMGGYPKDRTLLNIFANQLFSSPPDPVQLHTWINYIAFFPFPDVLTILGTYIQTTSDLYGRYWATVVYQSYEPPRPDSTSSTLAILDTVSSLLYQVRDKNWLGDNGFVAELNNHLSSARSLLSGDSLTCARQVRLFQQTVDDEYRDSLDGDNRFVTVEGWKFLYYNAQYILDRLPAIPSLTTYSLFATHSMHLEQNSKVFSGDIGVNVELSIGIGVTTAAGSSIKAHRIKVKSGATVHGSIHYNTIENNGTITGTQHTPLQLPLVAALPEFKSATPGTQYIEVPQNGTHTLQPGSYGDIRVRRNGRLILTGGTYHLSSFTGGDNVQLICQAAAEIRIAGKFDSGQGSFIGPEDTTLVSADQIMFYVGGINGTNGTLGATPKAAKIGIGNRVWASFYVPNGTLWIRQNSEATGQFIGKDVDVGIGVKVRKIMTMKNDE
jgi:hypothetical protein